MCVRVCVFVCVCIGICVWKWIWYRTYQNGAYSSNALNHNMEHRRVRERGTENGGRMVRVVDELNKYIY